MKNKKYVVLKISLISFFLFFVIDFFYSNFIKKTKSKNFYNRVIFLENENNKFFKNFNNFIQYYPNQKYKTLNIWKDKNSFFKEWEYSFTTNNAGNVQLFDIKNSNNKIIFIGDSFAEGVGAKPWFYDLETKNSNNRYDLINLGFLGTGFIDWEQRLKKFDDKNVIKIFILFISEDALREKLKLNLKCLDSNTCDEYSIFHNIKSYQNLDQIVNNQNLRKNNIKYYLKKNFYFFSSLYSFIKNYKKQKVKFERNISAINNLQSKWNKKL